METQTQKALKKIQEVCGLESTSLIHLGHFLFALNQVTPYYTPAVSGKGIFIFINTVSGQTESEMTQEYDLTKTVRENLYENKKLLDLTSELLDVQNH